MKILLTGASGFLGSNLAWRLLCEGHDVVLLARPRSDLAKRLGNDVAHFQVIRLHDDGDANLQRCLQDAVRSSRPDAVIHTACIYGRQGETMPQMLDANVCLGVGLLQALRDAGHQATFINTGTALDASVNAYALSKHQLRQWGELFAAQAGGAIQWINVKLEHMYGPGDDASKFTTHVLRACHHNEPTLKLTAGEQQRDFIFIDDVASAYFTLLNQRAMLPTASDIEVGSGQAPSIRAFVETVHRLTRSSTELQFGALPYRPNEAMHCQADISRMRELGWQPSFDLVAGLQKTIELEFP